MPSTQSRLEELRSLEPYEFEQFVANLWAESGWSTRVLPESNDYGIDIVATKADPTPQKLLIQAKRYREGNNVGGPAVQQYRSLLEQEPDADSVVIVTTSSFTSQARDLADRMNVKLVDGTMLLEMDTQPSEGENPAPTVSHDVTAASSDIVRAGLLHVITDPDEFIGLVVNILVALLGLYIIWEFASVLL